MLLRRHKILFAILRPLVIAFLYFKFGYIYKAAKEIPDTCIILSNHTTDFDPLFVSVSFRKYIRFIASEHIARWKHAYKFLDYVFNPIIRYKGANAASTVKEMLRTINKGVSVCMFAEGSRCWNGITAPIDDSTGKVVKRAKCALVTYKISGGYFTSPLWSAGGTRKGKIRGQVVNVYTAEQISEMTIDEINEIINNDLYIDAYEEMENSPTKYKGKQLAVALENLLFYCQHCNSMESLFSYNDTVKCKNCGCSFTYNEYGQINGLKQKNVKELFLWLKHKVENDAKNSVSYSSENACIVSIKNHIETFLDKGTISLSYNNLTCGNISFKLSEINDMNMHGKNSIVFSTKTAYYEIKVDDNTSALKFYMLFQAYAFGCINRFSF